MPDKIMAILAEVTGGKSYKAHKYGLDHADRPFIDYGEDSIIWKKTAETDKSNRKYVPLEVLSKTLSAREEQRLTYFLDGSRRVFKVDDIAYTKSGGRSAIYPVVAGQIGVGCCKRENKRLIPEKFKREFVLSIPDIANADGKAGFFPATARKLNESPELKRLGIEFATIIPYRTAKNAEKKFEDLGTACIQDRMSQREKELVAELVREGKLNQDNYLVKDGSLEYRPTKEDKADKRKYQIFKNNYNWVLGVSKNFNPEVCVDINGKPNPGFIADLPLYHRTPVACFKNPDWFGDTEFAVWYIRIRDKKRTRTPFDGIIKVEKILVTQEEIEDGIDSTLVNQLSAYLINERIKMRELITASEDGKKYTASEVLSSIYKFDSKNTGDKESHWFKVEMIGINDENTDLLDFTQIKEYLSFVAPVPYQNTFLFRAEVYKHAKEIGCNIDEYNIFLNGEQIFKKYKTIFKTSKGEDEVFNLAFKEIYDSHNHLLAWLWIGVSHFKAIISKECKMRGLRLRKENIQIGSEDALQKLFKEDRGQHYFVGEVFAVSKDLIPNSQRDYFNENTARMEFEKEMRQYFNGELSKIWIIMYLHLIVLNK